VSEGSSGGRPEDDAPVTEGVRFREEVPPGDGSPFPEEPFAAQDEGHGRRVAQEFSALLTALGARFGEPPPPPGAGGGAGPQGGYPGYGGASTFEPGFEPGFESGFEQGHESGHDAWHAAWQPGAAPPDSSGQSAECRICPVCQALRALRAARPEVVVHLEAATVNLLAAARALLAATPGAGPAAGPGWSAPPPPSAPRRPAAEHIDVTD